MQKDEDIPSTTTPTEVIGVIPFHSAPEAAAQALRKAILTGTLKPGERLFEGKLAASMGIGQPTLREALKDLEHQGFVTKVPKKGSYVTRLGREDYRKILQARLILETWAVGEAARHITPKDEAELEAWVGEMRAGTFESDLGKFHDSDVAFHRKIWALAGNEYVARMLQVPSLQQFAYALLDLGPELRRHNLAAVLQHEAILEGLRSQDPAEARRAFVAHTLRYWNEQHHCGLQEDELRLVL